MSDRYQHLMHLKPKQLHNFLEKRGDPPLVRNQIYETVVAQQARKANSNRRDAQVIRWWAPILAPLTNEIKVVRAMQQHDRFNEQRQEVVGAYMEALKKARGWISAAKTLGLTPQGLQQWRVDNGKKKFPNDLTHWTDLVPAKVQDAIREAFDALPYKPRAKRKVPFMREELPSTSDEE